MQTHDFTADRDAPFVRSMAFVGYDFTSATYKMCVALQTNTGSALLTLNTVSTDVQGVRTVYAGTDTLANHLTAGHLDRDDVDALLGVENPLTGGDYQLSDSVALTIIGIRIDKTNVQALPSNVGRDQVLYYNLHITPSGGDETNFVGGKFVVTAEAMV